RRISELLEGLEGVVNVADDIVVHGVDEKSHDANLERVLSVLKKANVILNREKCCFRTSEVTFMGHRISATGIQVCPDKVVAIREMPRPSNVKDLRRFCGMINYLRRFLPELAEKMVPLQQLLLKDSEWIWGPAQEKAFRTVKALVADAPCLQHYDSKKPLRVSADASCFDLGAVLEQKEGNGNWRPLCYAS